MTDPLEQALMKLHQANKPTHDFASQLEQQLRAAHTAQARPRPTRLIYRFATVAAAFAIIVGLFAALPPLHTLAQDILNFFRPAATYAPTEDASAYTDLVTVSTVAEAEKIAGFDALELGRDDFHILNVSAGAGFVSVIYEQDGLDHGNLIILTQYHTGSRPEESPVNPTTAIEAVTVNGQPGEFVAGSWFRLDGEDFEWQPDDFRQLYWQGDGISYHLKVTLSLAETASQAIEIAEALH